MCPYSFIYNLYNSDEEEFLKLRNVCSPWSIKNNGLCICVWIMWQQQRQQTKYTVDSQFVYSHSMSALETNVLELIWICNWGRLLEIERCIGYVHTTDAVIQSIGLPAWFIGNFNSILHGDDALVSIFDRFWSDNKLILILAHGLAYTV